MEKSIEVCVYSVQSAINAETGGAVCVELCANMFEGGTTPSAATIRLVREHISIAINVIIRPRGSDFCYSDIEFETMKNDILIAKEFGADGVVIGLLKPDGSIDIERTKELINLARPMKVTFHRAFDMTHDPFEAMETLIDLGVDRILTSGQKQTSFEGKELIGQLIKKCNGRINIMPGSGVNETNIEAIAEVTGAKQFHVTGKSIVPGKMKYKNESINMGGMPGIPEYEIIETCPEKIKTIVNLLSNKN